MTSQDKGSKGGFPIRRSLDQSSFAAPQGLSQRTTSFIASQRQGIHQMLLRHLITLTIHVRSAAHTNRQRKTCLFGFLQKTCFACQAYPAQRLRAVAGSRELGVPLAEYAASLRFQTSAPLTPERAGREPHDMIHDHDGSWPMDTPNIRHRGGACRDRTDDLKLAKLPLSQLS